jgi:hypothetical protein
LLDFRRVLFAVALFVASTVAAAGQTIPAASTNDNRAPAGTLANGVLSLHLEMRPAIWYPEEDGKAHLIVSAFAEEGHIPQIPGPMIRVPGGTEIAATIRNLLDHTIYVHGLAPRLDANAKPAAAQLDPTNTSDGANTLEIPTGTVREVRFKSGAPGSYYYWASNDRQSLLMRNGPDSVLSGAFLVDPPGARSNDRVFVINTWVPVGGNAFNTLPTINGKSWPYTESFTLQVGESVEWRWINASDSDHAMHLHGFYFHVNGVGDQDHFLAYSGSEQQTVVTQELLPGGTFTMNWVPERPGHWLMHCHMTFHMMQPESLPGYSGSSGYTSQNAGMGGLVLIGRKLIAMAEDFPEDKYDFKAAPTARTFAERLIHAAAANYYFTNLALGQKPPADEDPPRTQFKNKAALVAYVKKSFAEGAAAIKAKGDKGILESVVDPFAQDNPSQAGKDQIRLIDLAHSINEHSGEVYGQLSVYYRVAGFIPPESRPKK